MGKDMTRREYAAKLAQYGFTDLKSGGYVVVPYESATDLGEPDRERQSMYLVSAANAPEATYRSRLAYLLRRRAAFWLEARERAARQHEAARGRA